MWQQMKESYLRWPKENQARTANEVVIVTKPFAENFVILMSLELTQKVCWIVHPFPINDHDKLKLLWTIF